MPLASWVMAATAGCRREAAGGRRVAQGRLQRVNAAVLTQFVDSIARTTNGRAGAGSGPATHLRAIANRATVDMWLDSGLQMPRL